MSRETDLVIQNCIRDIKEISAVLLRYGRHIEQQEEDIMIDVRETAQRLLYEDEVEALRGGEGRMACFTKAIVWNGGQREAG